MCSRPRLIIAGMRGGSGKTTATLAVIAGLRALGHTVSPFKKGPDYIDAGWLSVAAGSSCYTLDPFLIPPAALLKSFSARHIHDIAIIEGNRGLHDGKDVQGSCSTAEVAKLLDCPVLLVVDCTKMTRTAAALVLGCMRFDEAVQVKGVVLNQVSGNRHAVIVREAIEKYCGIPVVGVVPRMKAGEMPERHMGLTPHQEHDDVSRALRQAEKIARQHLDMPSIATIIGESGEFTSGETAAVAALPASSPAGGPSVRIGVLKDAAFQFYYPENLEELAARGAEIVEIDALHAAELPSIDALYIGGGFPETNALRLAENRSFRDSVKRAAERGLPVYAECGGLMFLGEALIVDGVRHPMSGVFPLTFAMNKRPQAHGYSIAAVRGDNPFYDVGTRLNGHEFHYSSTESYHPADGITFAFHMERGEGILQKQDGICYRNVLATYTHIHALGTPEWADGMIRKAREYHG
jgi:cobyrinic acid a,c-diamide synthase